MANVAMSNRERREQRKRAPKAPRRAKGDAVVRLAADAGAVRNEEMDGRDGLKWLEQKRRLTPTQIRAAKHCSDIVRDAGEVSIKSCIGNEGAGGGGGANGYSPSPIVSAVSARRELFTLRYIVLRGQPDMILVVEGVCGARHTLRYLAGDDKHRARDLEVTLKLALDLVAAYLDMPKVA